MCSSLTEIQAAALQRTVYPVWTSFMCQSCAEPTGNCVIAGKKTLSSPAKTYCDICLLFNSAFVREIFFLEGLKLNYTNTVHKPLPPSPVRGGSPLGPGTPKCSNSGTSVDSELELAMGTVVRPRFITLGGRPEGGGGGSEGVGVTL